jgi:hypothetical protein
MHRMKMYLGKMVSLTTDDVQQHMGVNATTVGDPETLDGFVTFQTALYGLNDFGMRWLQCHKRNNLLLDNINKRQNL